ncbi:MAG: DUF1192 domain-containing protein [Pseudomonadota bacterium]
MEEEEPKKPSNYQIGSDLADMSVDELLELAAELKQEAARLEAEAKAKRSSIDAASALFQN